MQWETKSGITNTRGWVMTPAGGAETFGGTTGTKDISQEWVSNVGEEELCRVEYRLKNDGFIYNSPAVLADRPPCDAQQGGNELQPRYQARSGENIGGENPG